MVQQRRKQLVVKICCIIAAFTLWLVTSNDENINVTYKISNIPIEVINEEYLIQSGLIIMPNQKFTTTLKVTGKPSEVYSVKADEFKIVADLSTYALKKGENRIPINIIKRPSKDVNILNDGAMWISVKVDNYKERTMPIKVNIKGNLKSGFSDGTPLVKPESALVSGAEEYINLAYEVIAEVDLGNQDKSLNQKVSLKVVDRAGREIEELKVSPKIADVVVPIQKTKEVGININTTGELPKDFILKSMDLNKEKVIITGEPKDLLYINKLETEPIDLSKIKSEKSTISLKLIIPPNIKLLDETEIVSSEITLDKVQQKNLNLNINIINLTKGLAAELDKKDVSIVVSGGKTAVNQLTNDKINCYVNLEALGKGEYTLPINLELPEGIDIITQNIKFVRVNLKDEGLDSVENNTDNSKEVNTKPKD